MCYNITAVARPLHLLLDILLWPSLGPFGRSCPRACQQSDSNELTVPMRLCHQLHRVVFFSSLRHSLHRLVIVKRWCRIFRFLAPLRGAPRLLRCLIRRSAFYLILGLIRWVRALTSLRSSFSSSSSLFSSFPGPFFVARHYAVRLVI